MDITKQVSIIEWYKIVEEVLGTDVASKWIKNIVKLDGSYQIYYLVQWIFSWSASPEGGDFWVKQNANFISRIKVLKDKTTEPKVEPTPAPSVPSYEESVKLKEAQDEKKRAEFKKIHDEAMKIAKKAKKQLAERLSALSEIDSEDD